MTNCEKRYGQLGRRRGTTGHLPSRCAKHNGGSGTTRDFSGHCCFHGGSKRLRFAALLPLVLPVLIAVMQQEGIPAVDSFLSDMESSGEPVYQEINEARGSQPKQGNSFLKQLFKKKKKTAEVGNSKTVFYRRTPQNDPRSENPSTLPQSRSSDHIYEDVADVNSKNSSTLSSYGSSDHIYESVPIRNKSLSDSGGEKDGKAAGKKFSHRRSFSDGRESSFREGNRLSTHRSENDLVMYDNDIYESTSHPSGNNAMHAKGQTAARDPRSDSGGQGPVYAVPSKTLTRSSSDSARQGKNRKQGKKKATDGGKRLNTGMTKEQFHQTREAVRKQLEGISVKNNKVADGLQ